jgi:hypothetical protein
MDLTTPETLPIHHAGEQCTAVARHLAWIGDRWTLPVVVTLQERPFASISFAGPSPASLNRC